ncbi:MAG: hypothetical protein NT135_02780 [Candidatus Berkelbacteria bacterium]|nr:hypothetical protein [Candidatus Berkelbacteria bacterium]
MSKKHRKIFKQKLKKMLSEIDQGMPVKKPLEAKPMVVPEQEEQAPVEISEEKVEKSVFSIASVPHTKHDLKKTAIIFGIMVIVIVAVSIVSVKTSAFSFVADKIYSWAQLGS